MRCGREWTTCRGRIARSWNISILASKIFGGIPVIPFRRGIENFAPLSSYASPPLCTICNPQCFLLAHLASFHAPSVAQYPCDCIACSLALDWCPLFKGSKVTNAPFFRVIQMNKMLKSCVCHATQEGGNPKPCTMHARASPLCQNANMHFVQLGSLAKLRPRSRRLRNEMLIASPLVETVIRPSSMRYSRVSFFMQHYNIAASPGNQRLNVASYNL